MWQPSFLVRCAQWTRKLAALRRPISTRPEVRHERADPSQTESAARDQVPRERRSELHIGPRPGRRWSIPVHSSNHALEPALPCRQGYAACGRARRLRREHIARRCPLTDIEGSTGSTRCALGRGTSTGTACCGRRTLINRGRRLPHGAGNGFSWSVVSSSSLWSSGSWDCRPTIRRCAPRHLWKRHGRSYPTICRTDGRSCPRRDAPSWLPTSKRWKRMPTMRRRSCRDPSE